MNSGPRALCVSSFNHHKTSVRRVYFPPLLSKQEPEVWGSLPFQIVPGQPKSSGSFSLNHAQICCLVLQRAHTTLSYDNTSAAKDRSYFPFQLSTSLLFYSCFQSYHTFGCMVNKCRGSIFQLHCLTIL
jgi:hypothetical protein